MPPFPKGRHHSLWPNARGRTKLLDAERLPRGHPQSGRRRRHRPRHPRAGERRKHRGLVGELRGRAPRRSGRADAAAGSAPRRSWSSQRGGATRKRGVEEQARSEPIITGAAAVNDTRATTASASIHRSRIWNRDDDRLAGQDLCASAGRAFPPSTRSIIADEHEVVLANRPDGSVTSRRTTLQRGVEDRGADRALDRELTARSPDRGGPVDALRAAQDEQQDLPQMVAEDEALHLRHRREVDDTARAPLVTGAAALDDAATRASLSNQMPSSVARKETNTFSPGSRSVSRSG